MSDDKKGRLALYWAASCGGCEIAVLAINEKILDVAALFEIVFWPVAVDAKVRDVERMPDGSIDVCLFNGGIRTSEQEYMAHLLRRKAKVLVAFGSCATKGASPGSPTCTAGRRIFQTVYQDTVSTENPDHVEPQHQSQVPEGELQLPVFYDTLQDAGSDGPGRLLSAGLPTRSRTHLGGDFRDRQPDSAAARLGPGRGHDRVSRVSANARLKRRSRSSSARGR